MRARITAAICLLVPAALAYACGGDDSIISGTDDGGADQSAPKDTGSGGDGTTTNDTGSSDTGSSDTGSTADSAGDTGATADGGATDSGSAFLCKKPSDCSNTFCCGSITFNGGTAPNCTLVDASASCKGTCISNVNALSCKTTDTMRSCAVTADCADAGAGYTKCCNVPFQDAAATFCWNSFFAQQAGGTCL